MHQITVAMEIEYGIDVCEVQIMGTVMFRTPTYIFGLF